MSSLASDLQKPKSSMNEFYDISNRILNYMPEIINEQIEYSDYMLYSSTMAGTRKTIRPVNKNLFIKTANQFNNQYTKFSKVITKLKNNTLSFSKDNFEVIDKIIYTIQQSIGIGLDLLVEPNSARKHVGNRFEELIRTMLTEMNIPIKKVILNIPYETDEGTRYYRCETDVIISPYKSVKSNSQNIDPNEIIISLKTTTKDRMPKIFIDKILMERFLGHSVKMVGISQNDVQRKEDKGNVKISYTFVSNLFMVYTKFLAELEGYYYLDIPKRALQSPFNNHIFPFSKFILNDIWKLLNS